MKFPLSYHQPIFRIPYHIAESPAIAPACAGGGERKKSPGPRALGMHQDNTYLAWYAPREMLSCRIPFDNTTAAGGTLVIACGSHRWSRASSLAWRGFISRAVARERARYRHPSAARPGRSASDAFQHIGGGETHVVRAEGCLDR